jgi:hypothetical protein
MTEYPFIFLGHGELFPEAIDKNEEIFIWFKREVKKDEQKKIMKDCPPPVDFVYFWGKEFVYYGSGGDTYDLGKSYTVTFGKMISGGKPQIKKFAGNEDLRI